jgi:AAA domain
MGLRGLLDPKNFADPLADVGAQITRYLESESGSETVESVFCKPNGKGLFIAVEIEGGSKRRYLLCDLDGQSVDVGESTDSGLHSFEELKALDLPKPEPIIENLVFVGETVLVAGRPKVGKTRLVHQMAFSIVGGAPFLGMDVPTRRRVLIVDLENKAGAIRDRLVRMAGGASAPGLFVWSARSLSEDVINATPEGISRLLQMIEKTAAEVLIIDPWRLWLGKDENNAEEVVRGLRALFSLRESYPLLTIIIVHHVRKEKFESPRKLLADPRLWVESVSGHHALISHVDACYGLERQREDDGEEWIVFGGIARNTDPRTLLLEDDEDTLRFEVRHSEDALEAVLTKKEREIWSAAVKLANFGFNELAETAGATNR